MALTPSSPIGRTSFLGRWLPLGLLAAMTLLLSLDQTAFAYKNEIGYNALVADWEGAVPDGTGVLVSMVEADEDNNQENANHLYLPTSPSSVHADLTGITFTNGSSVSSPSKSGHAQGMARQFVGSNLSVANGVSEVIVYEADHYLNSILNLTPSSAGPPDVPSYKIQNHSWVGSFESSADNLEALRRIDYLIDTHDVTMAVGLNNGSANSHPILLSHSYNSIAVGRTDGGHSRGVTTLGSYGSGRMKPDIVAPRGSTSAATAAVSSVATMLYQSATDTVNFPSADAEAAYSESMKAILLAGATKEEFTAWENVDDEQPLDTVYGAGELNVRNSFLIQQGGQHEGSASVGAAPVANYGWDYGSVASGGGLFYEIEVPQFHTGADLSAVLTWNVEITDTNSGSPFSPSHNLANLDLRLYDSSGSPLGALLLNSASTKDNVEHVYLEDLTEGTYTLQVLSVNGARDFGLAWRLDTQAPYRASGDYNEDGLVDALDYSLWRTLLGSDTDLSADGDLNGIVDSGDYAVWRAAYGSTLTPPVVAPANLSAEHAPEPTAGLLFASLVACGMLARRR